MAECVPEKWRSEMSLNALRKFRSGAGVAASAKRRQYVVLRSWLVGFGSGVPTLWNF